MGGLIYIEQHVRAEIPWGPEKETLPLVGERLAGLFDPPAAPDRSGLYLASRNAGFQSSLLFWADAQRSGLAVANPELFPWTLANAPCGWLARHFQITGPNYTYTGQADALVAAIGQAYADLQENLVESAWVVALDFAQNARQRTVLAALRLGSKPAPLGLRAVPANGNVPKRQAGAAAILSLIISQLAQPAEDVIFSHGTQAFCIMALADNLKNKKY